MKFTKKMKLVECDDESATINQYSQQLNNDSEYTKPRVLSKLDTIMSQILYRKDIADSEKWKLYTQMLQRYQHFMNRDPAQIGINTQIPAERDSLDTITQPRVREFFEKARESAPVAALFSNDTTYQEISPQRLRSGSIRSESASIPRKRRRMAKKVDLAKLYKLKKLSIPLKRVDNWEPFKQ